MANSLIAYSTTAGSNTSAPPDGAPEAMAANTVNNTMRQMMANMRLLSDCTTGAFADIASASTTNIGAANNHCLRVTGTTTITAFDTVTDPAIRILRFAGALTLTHNGTSLILPGAANITTVAGDTAIFVSLGSGNWFCVDYTPTTISGTGAQLRQTSPSITSPTIATPVITGFTDASSAASGKVGEILTAAAASGSVSLSNSTLTDIITLSLTAGQWMVGGWADILASGSSTLAEAGLSLTSVTMPGVGTQGMVQIAFNAISGARQVLSTGTIHVNVNTTTTVYLVGLCNFSTSTTAAGGTINAIRIR